MLREWNTFPFSNVSSKMTNQNFLLFTDFPSQANLTISCTDYYFSLTQISIILHKLKSHSTHFIRVDESKFNNT